MFWQVGQVRLSCLMTLLPHPALLDSPGLLVKLSSPVTQSLVSRLDLLFSYSSQFARLALQVARTTPPPAPPDLLPFLLGQRQGAVPCEQAGLHHGEGGRQA